MLLDDVSVLGRVCAVVCKLRTLRRWQCVNAGSNTTIPSLHQPVSTDFYEQTTPSRRHQAVSSKDFHKPTNPLP